MSIVIYVKFIGQYNEFLIGWSSGFYVWVQGATGMGLSDRVDELWVGWNKHCFTYKAGDSVKVW